MVKAFGLLDSIFSCFLGRRPRPPSLAVTFEGGYSIRLGKSLPAFIGGYLSGKALSVRESPSREALRVVEKVKGIQREWGTVAYPRVRNLPWVC